MKIKNFNSITFGNNYKQYNNGFLEQWGTVTSNDAYNIVINFPKAFKDTNYTLVITSIANRNPGSDDGLGGVKNKTTKNATCSSGSTDVKTISWYACGY